MQNSVHQHRWTKEHVSSVKRRAKFNNSGGIKCSLALYYTILNKTVLSRCYFTLLYCTYYVLTFATSFFSQVSQEKQIKAQLAWNQRHVRNKNSNNNNNNNNNHNNTSSSDAVLRVWFIDDDGHLCGEFDLTMLRSCWVSSKNVPWVQTLRCFFGVICVGLTQSISHKCKPTWVFSTS